MWRKRNWEEREIVYSRHHILPTSQNWANNDANVEVIRDVQHRAIHTLFENKMIAEQLIRTIGLSEKALRPDVVRWLIDTLNSRDINDPTAWYRADCIE